MATATIYNIVDVLKAAFPTGAPLHTPVLDGNEQDYLNQCVESTYVSSVGKFVDQFEELFAKTVGAKHAVATCSGTAALHICLRLCEVKPDDEVLLPALTFVATANAVLHCGAIPHFVDVSQDTYGIDSHSLRNYLQSATKIIDNTCVNINTGRAIKAIVPVHVFGCTVDMDPVVEVAKEFHLKVIEDAAEALGSMYKDHHVGTLSDISAFSFNGNKIVTAGGGGAIVTNNEKLAKIAKHITTTAKISHPWEYIHDQQGFNYRMPNINAALACAQLERLDQFIKNKNFLYQQYLELFAPIPSASIFCAPDFCTPNHWLINLVLEDDIAPYQQELLENLCEQKIQARPPWRCLHKLDFLKSCPHMDLPVSEKLQGNTISLPSSSHQKLQLD